MVSFDRSPSKPSSSRPVSLVQPVLSTYVRRRSRAHRGDRCEARQLPGGVLARRGPPLCPRAGARRHRKGFPRRGGGSRRLGPGHCPLVPSAPAATSCSRSAARAVPRSWRSTTGGSVEGCSRLTCLCRAAAFAWDGRLLWAAGSELTTSPVDDYRWEDLQGGRYAGLDPSNGQMVVAGALPDDVAWGSGGRRRW